MRSLFCFLLTILGFATSNTNTLNEQLQQIISKNNFPGFHYTVLDRSGINFQFNHGYQDIAGKSPVTADTMFMLNSSTKVFTAAAILQLVKTGKVNLDSPLTAYFKHHPYGTKISIRHLLNQTSGLANPLPLKWLHLKNEHATYNENQTLQHILNEHSELKFPPGKKYMYSNISYWLLGKVIENVSGISYCQYLQEFVFKPLMINRDELSCDMPDETHFAKGYQEKYTFLTTFFYLAGASPFFAEPEGIFSSFKPVYHNGPAYGGLYGSGHGVAKFLNDLLATRPQVFDKQIRHLFFEEQVNHSGKPIAMTLGWRTGELNGIKFYEKPGGGPGSHGNIRIYPQKNIATVYFVNNTAIQEKSISALSNKMDWLYFQSKATHE